MVTPDWILDSAESGRQLIELLYHPRLLLTEKPADVTEVVAMDTSDLEIGDVAGNEAKEEAKKTKESLAAMVSSRSVYCE